MIAAVLAYFCRNDCSTKSIARCSWPISPHARASKRFRADTDPSTHRPARFVFLKRRREIHHPFSCVFFFFRFQTPLLGPCTPTIEGNGWRTWWRGAVRVRARGVRPDHRPRLPPGEILQLSGASVLHQQCQSLGCVRSCLLSAMNP